MVPFMAWGWGGALLRLHSKGRLLALARVEVTDSVKHSSLSRPVRNILQPLKVVNEATRNGKVNAQLWSMDIIYRM